MKKYNITVNGKTYEVEVEEIGGSTAPAAPKVTPAPAAPAPTPAPVQASLKAEPSKPVPAGAKTVKAPIPGTILDIKVSEGQSISQGQLLFILEAMKMENEIFSPFEGVVTSIEVSKGASVNAGEVLLALE